MERFLKRLMVVLLTFRLKICSLYTLITSIISPWVAEHVYQVMYDPKTFLVDAEGTAVRREQFLQERIQRGKPFSAFTGEWSERKPSGSILSYYGTWPDGKPVAPVFRL